VKRGPPENGDRPEPRAATLGDVLYAEPERARESEAEWVALVRSVAGGDQRALQALYDRANRIVYTLGYRITGNRETAEEVTLDVFHDVWRRAPEYDPANGPVVGWIMNLARSRAIDRARFDHRRKRSGEPSGSAPADGESGQPLERLQALDEGRLLRQALTRLTSAERQAIEVAYFSGLSYAETAALLGEPLGTVKTRIRSGLDKLRQALDGRASES
jgi:RNA polymerase sigma-70 factor (ECF subfamily)